MSQSLRNGHSLALIFGQQVFDKIAQLARIVPPNVLVHSWFLLQRLAFDLILRTSEKLLAGDDVEENDAEAVHVDPLIIGLILENAFWCQVSDCAEHTVPSFVHIGAVASALFCHAKVGYLEVTDVALIINSYQDVLKLYISVDHIVLVAVLQGM